MKIQNTGAKIQISMTEWQISAWNSNDLYFQNEVKLKSLFFRDNRDRSSVNLKFQC